MKLWDVTSGHEVATLHGRDFEVSRVTFLPRGQTIVSAGFGNTVRVWDAEPARVTGVRVRGSEAARDHGTRSRP